MEARNRQPAARAACVDAGAGHRSAEHSGRRQAGRHRQRHLRQPVRLRRRERKDPVAEALGLSGAGGPRRRRPGAAGSEASRIPPARRQQRHAGDRSCRRAGPAAGLLRHWRRDAPHHQRRRRHRPSAAVQVLWRKGLGAESRRQHPVAADHLWRRIDRGRACRRSRAQGDDVERRQRRRLGPARRGGGFHRHGLDHHRRRRLRPDERSARATPTAWSACTSRTVS